LKSISHEITSRFVGQRRTQRAEAASNFYTLTIVNIKRDSFELCILSLSRSS
jgi:hypothetical protein